MVDEAARHALYRSLEAAIGAEATGTMMTLLPPVGWAEVATKDDLRQLEARLDARLEGQIRSLESQVGRLEGRMEQRMAELETGLTAAMRTQLFALLGAMFSMSALTVAASAVLG